MQFHLPDPRAFAHYDASDAHFSNAYIDSSLASLAAEQGVLQEKADTRLRHDMAAELLAGTSAGIRQAMLAAPSLAVLRHLARAAAEAQVLAGRADGDDGLPSTVFAIPLVIVAGSPNPVNIPGALPNAAEVTALMKHHGALKGNASLSLSNALTPAANLGVDTLANTLDWWRMAARGDDGGLVAVPKAAMAVPANQESVFLRFILGRAIAGPGVNLLDDRDTGKWGIPFTQALAGQLGGGSISLLAMPRPPRSPLSALYQGLAAQREVSLQLFATNAIRKFRSSVGEPEAVISAHRTDSGGQVRLSLSNVFDEKGAEGFCAELYATDRAQVVAVMMQDLLKECGVASVTTLAEVFPDIDETTKLPLLFRADTLNAAAAKAIPAVQLH